MTRGACAFDLTVVTRGTLRLWITTEEIAMDTLPVNGMRPIHPGEVLREEFLNPYGLSGHALAMALQVPAPRINDIIRERRAITVDTALRLAKFFGTSAEFWLGLQTDYDMALVREPMRDAIDRIRRFQPAQA